MKVPNINVISSVVSSAGKHVNQVTEGLPKCANESAFLTNTLESMASSARAVIDPKKNEILSNFDFIIDKFKSGEGAKEFITNGKNIARDIKILNKPGRLIDNYVPIYKSKSEALEKSLTGDVFQIQGDKAVSILNRKGEVEQLKMDRQSYFDMFPPLERFMSIQPKYGICYEITALNAVMENPRARENMLRCIDTVSKKGEIKVTFPNGKKSGHLIKPETIEDSKAKDFYAQADIGLRHNVKSCTGLRYIQYALGKEYEKPFIEYTIAKLEKEGNKSTAREIQKMARQNNHDGIRDLCDGEHKNATLATNLREAGDAIVPWRLMGFERNGTIEAGDYLSKEEPAKILIKDRKFLDAFKDDNLVTSEEEFLDKLCSPEFFENHLVEAYVGNEKSASDLEHWHSFRLAPILDDAGDIEAYALKNPHGVTDKRIEFSDIADKIDSISFARID